MKQILKHILILAFAAGFIGTACENNDLNIDAGTFPETGGIGLSMGILQSDNYAMENPQINMDHASLSDQFHISLTEPASQTGNYTVKVDESKVLDFNSKHGTSYPLYPTEYIDLGNSGKMTIEKGEQQSNSVSIAFKYDEAIEDSVIYVLPLTVEENNSSPAMSSERKTLYYIINVWGMAPAEYNAIKKNFIQTAGVDPEFTNPLLLNKLYFESMSLSSPEVDYYNPFDIINLQFATVKADDNLLPSLYLKDDLAYVLKKREKYIVPLQQLDHKVCLAIKGAGEGIGFSNLGEKEMMIFVERIKQMIDIYHLDGVNLYDANFSYEESNENINYSNNLCKFVASLRDKLGNKIITYTQTSESPEGITNDANLKLGELLDYAWCDQLNTIIDPWSTPEKWTRPIAGLNKEKWGALNTDIHMSSEQANILDQVIEMFTQPSLMITAGINHVFVVNRVDYVSAGTESYAPTYMAYGAICNLCDMEKEYFVTGINSPNNQYLNIHDLLMPKDY